MHGELSSFAYVQNLQCLLQVQDKSVFPNSSCKMSWYRSFILLLRHVKYNRAAMISRLTDQQKVNRQLLDNRLIVLSPVSLILCDKPQDVLEMCLKYTPHKPHSHTIWKFGAIRNKINSCRQIVPYPPVFIFYDFPLAGYGWIFPGDYNKYIANFA